MVPWIMDAAKNPVRKPISPVPVEAGFRYDKEGLGGCIEGGTVWLYRSHRLHGKDKAGGTP